MKKGKWRIEFLKDPTREGQALIVAKTPAAIAMAEVGVRRGELEVVKGMLPESGNDFVRSLRVYRIVQGSKPISQGKSCDKE